MSDAEQPQIYLITPPAIALSSFPDTLARVMDGRDIACLRLALAADDEDDIARAADALRPIAHDRDIPLVIDTHFRLVERLGLDGVHLPDGGRNLRTVRKDLGGDAIIGAHCGASRHAGLNAGEAGADYVSFGPVGATPLGDGTVAERDLFRWWSEMIELPVVAEGALTHELIEDFAPVADFFGIGPEIWSEEDPLAALLRLVAPLD
ncbi:thiamine phosphate synthase [Maritimibacter sp. 55A14]|uniref:thiamine phosphate synthase n=1 Tax=Maritimibacter sp. 55A14 TaxID=2174844 RepID=UPI000D60C8D3|nr:thiamine phosphate synthase [Maritimibacter sp. 55A14]PWE33061.1 thiamine phosphate synthase [Maritimibacter sp. 55A14]